MFKRNEEHSRSKKGDDHYAPKSIEKNRDPLVLPLDQLINPAELRVCDDIGHCQVSFEISVSKNLSYSVNSLSSQICRALIYIHIGVKYDKSGYGFDFFSYQSLGMMISMQILDSFYLLGCGHSVCIFFN